MWLFVQQISCLLSSSLFVLCCRKVDSKLPNFKTKYNSIILLSYKRNKMRIHVAENVFLSSLPELGVKAFLTSPRQRLVASVVWCQVWLCRSRLVRFLSWRRTSSFPWAVVAVLIYPGWKGVTADVSIHSAGAWREEGSPRREGSRGRVKRKHGVVCVRHVKVSFMHVKITCLSAGIWMMRVSLNSSWRVCSRTVSENK